MKKALLPVLVFLLTCGHTVACGGLNVPAYSGEIRYSFGQGGKPLTCSMVATLYFDVDDGLENDSILVYWGDGKFSMVYGTSIKEDTTRPVGFPGMKPLFQHIYEGEHTYDSIPAGGYCHISIVSQYRLNYTSNVGGGLTSNVPFYIEAVALMDTSTGFSNQAPFMQAPGVKFGSASNIFSLNPVASLPDPDGDSIVFEITDPLEGMGTPVPDYLYPDQFCNKYNPGSTTYTINPETGEITWSAPCYQGIFTITTAVKKYRNGQLMGIVMRDQSLYIGSRVITDMEDNMSIEGLKLYGNPVENTLRGELATLNYKPTLAQIIGMDGRIITTSTITPNVTFNIDVASLATGVYLLHMNDGVFTHNRKFIKF